MHIIDNINVRWGDDLKTALHEGGRVKIAAACFSIYAFEALKRELTAIDSLEFIFTSPTFVPEEVSDKIKKEHREFYIPRLHLEREVFGTEFEIQLRNQMTQRAIARECAQWIAQKARFKSNTTRNSMQQFACMSTDVKEVAYMPLQGFTTADLGYQQGNAISNFITRFDEPTATRQWITLFDQIWQSEDKVRDVTEELRYHIESIYKENGPEKIYFLILYNIFNEFLVDLEEDILPNDKTGYQDTIIWNKLFNFQKDAAIGVINKLEKYNGCILADSVGLGKTFTALAVIKYYELRNRSVLVLCPKKLAENWTNYNKNLVTNILHKDRLNYDVLCHTDLLRTTGDSLGIPLDRVNWGNYDLIVIDESHNFRNNDAFKDKETRYQRLMNEVIRKGVKTKVLMLSATPVNNRFNDLRNQLALAYEGESVNLSKQLKSNRSIEEIFKGAQKAFNEWAKLPVAQRTPQAILQLLDFDFFEVLDAVTIARSRKHIEQFYDTKDIGKFPERLKPLSFRCGLTDLEGVMNFNDIYHHLIQLTLAIYAPMNYVLPSRRGYYEDQYDTEVAGGGRGKLKQADRERSLQMLMTINLLKRLESSVFSFRKTLRMLSFKYHEMSETIERYKLNPQETTISDFTDQFDNLDADDDDIPWMEGPVTGGKIKVRLADMDLDSWSHDLEADKIIFDLLLMDMDQITPEHDLKLNHLIDHIHSKIQHPINSGNKKVLVFTAFADTALYLYQNLSKSNLDQNGLHTGLVTGKDTPQSTLRKGLSFQHVMTLFSPRAKEKHLTMPHEAGEIDLLIGTDCISEGQNLQDCDYLINYDIHWNPVRIIQRFGRIDRIGSPNDLIQLVNYWPDISLDEYINLKERVENRMVIVDVSAGGDDNVLTAETSDLAYRKEQLRKMQEEVIDLEDLKTGVNIMDLGLNDFRMDLLQFIKSGQDLSKLPNGLHAVLPAQKGKGLEPGVMFVLRNRNADINIHLQNRLHPYYLVYIRPDGTVILPHTEVKSILDLIRSGCKGLSDPILEICQSFNQETDDGRDMKRYSELLTQTIDTIIGAREKNDVQSLFTSQKTTVLLSPIHGMEDFELIAFLVIRDA